MSNNTLSIAAFVVAGMATSQALAHCGHTSACCTESRFIGQSADGPGAAAYGAAEDRHIVVHVDALFPFEPPLAVKINPFHRVEGFNGDRPISYPGVGHASEGSDGMFTNAYTRGLDKIANRVESARQDWLKDNGFVGGVRVFKSTSTTSTEVEGAALPGPRGIIVVPDEIKRQRTRFQVKLDTPVESEAEVETQAQPVRISTPPVMQVSSFKLDLPGTPDLRVAQLNDVK